MIGSKLMLAAAVATVTSQPAAPAPTLPCLDPPALRALGDFTLNHLATALANRCATDFAAVSPTLAANKAALSTRFNDEADAAWPTLRNHMMKADPKMEFAMAELQQHEVALRALLGAIAGKAAVEKIDAKSCAAADALAAALLPLNDQQIGALFTAMLQLGLQNEKRANGSIHVCTQQAVPAPAPAIGSGAGR